MLLQAAIHRPFPVCVHQGACAVDPVTVPRPQFLVRPLERPGQHHHTHTLGRCCWSMLQVHITRKRDALLCVTHSYSVYPSDEFVTKVLLRFPLMNAVISNRPKARLRRGLGSSTCQRRHTHTTMHANCSSAWPAGRDGCTYTTRTVCAVLLA